MRRLCLPFLCCVFLTLLLFPFKDSYAQSRKTGTINSLWHFHKGDLTIDQVGDTAVSWKIVNIPHTWNKTDILPGHKRTDYRGTGWYYKKLNKKFDTSESAYFLHFEGVGQLAVLYINGEKVGKHAGGYTGFTFNITPYLKPAGNTIAVRVDNSFNPDIPPLSADYTFYGGIYRDVFLIETAKSHFTLLNYGSKGIFVSTPQVTAGKANVSIRGSFINATGNNKNLSLRYVIRDPQKKTIIDKRITEKMLHKGKIHFRISDCTIMHPQLWNPKNPYLYTVDIQLLQNGVPVDEEHIPFGIRTFRFDPDKGFFLNGKSLKLIGASRHQDYLGMGNALSDEQHRNDLKWLKKMGGNFMRLAHYPQDPAVLEEADKLGILIWEEIPIVNTITLSERFTQNTENMLKEMIRQNYNHPSVIIWGYMNEIFHRFNKKVSIDLQKKGVLHLAKTLDSMARKEDPSRYTAMAFGHNPLYEESGLDTIPQIVGWNLYDGWYYGQLKDFGKFMDEQHQKYPDRIHIISEFGVGSDPRIHSLHPEKFDYSIEYQKRFLESYLQQIKARPYIAGAAVWNLIDFSSESRIGPDPRVNIKGIMTYNRKPKDTYYYFQACLSQKPYVKIAETDWTDRSYYAQHADTPSSMPVQVYTNMKEVELFQNGHSLGVKKAKNNSAVWEVHFANGENHFKAAGRGENHEVADNLAIHYREIPFSLSDKNKIDISVNVGSNCFFYDKKGRNTWVPDKPYVKGSWGYIGGTPLYIGKKIGTREPVLTLNDFIPLFQTMRQGIQSYKFDVKDGWYELELLFVAPYPKSRRFVKGDESPKKRKKERVFNVYANGRELFSQLDLFKEYGYNYPLKKRIIIKAQNGQGIKVRFESIKGKTLLSGIRIRSL